MKYEKWGNTGIEVSKLCGLHEIRKGRHHA